MSSNIFCLWRKVKSKFSHLREKNSAFKGKAHNLCFFKKKTPSLNKLKLYISKAIELKVIVENQKAIDCWTFFLKNICSKCKN